MAYGTVKVNNITFDNGGLDQNITVSGLYNALTSGVSVTGTVSGSVVIGSTSVSGNIVLGTTVTGTTVQGASGTFTSLTGTTTTGTTANFVSGVFSTRVSGATITGNTAQFTSGTFVSLTGTTITGTTINGGTVNSTTGAFTSLTGTTITGTTINAGTVSSTTGNFTSLTGTTVTGTTANFVSGRFTTQVSGTTVTGTTSNFTSGNFATLSGTTATFTSGVIASGTATNPSLSFVGDPNTGIFSPGADQVAVATNGIGRLFISNTDTQGNAFRTVGASNAFVAQGATSGSAVFGPATSTGGAKINANTGVDSSTFIDFDAPQISADGGSLTYRFGRATTEGATSRLQFFKHNNSGTVVFEVNSSGLTRVAPDGLEAFRITSAGRVGIGTTSPSSSLEITGNQQFSDGANRTIFLSENGRIFSIINNNARGASASELRLMGRGVNDFITFRINEFERARIDSGGRLLVGTSTALPAAGSTPAFQVVGDGAASWQSLIRTGATVGGSNLALGQTRGSVGSRTIAQNNDILSTINFVGDDGTDLNTAAAWIRGEVDGTPGADDMPGRLVFSTTADGASFPTERMRIRSDGNIGIGGTGSNAVTLYNQKAITGATAAFANYTLATIQSDVTSAAYGYISQLTTAAASFTLDVVHNFFANPSATFGAGSSVTTQYGFHASGTLTGATNNYGFFGNIASATGRWNFYANGTAPNYFAGDVRTNTAFTARTVPADSNTAVTLTAASILDGLRTGTPTGNINYTLPTGTNMDAAFQELQTNQSFEWSVINLAGATHVITVVANTGHTVSGNMAVAANSSGRFLTRKTAANTFVTYRIA